MARLRLGQLRMIRGEFPAALEDLGAAIELSRADPPSPTTEYQAEQQRSVAWLLSGDLESHQRRCRELLQQFGDSEEVARLKAIVGCCRQHPASVEDWSKVIEIAERVVQLPPKDPWNRSSLFLILCRAGKPAEALERISAVGCVRASRGLERVPTGRGVGHSFPPDLGSLGRTDRVR